MFPRLSRLLTNEVNEEYEKIIRQEKKYLTLIWDLIAREGLSSLEELLAELDAAKRKVQDMQMSNTDKIKEIVFITKVKTFLCERIYPTDGEITDKEFEKFRRLDRYRLAEGFLEEEGEDEYD